MQTSQQWLNSVKANKEKFNRWLSQQWLAEVKATDEIQKLSSNATVKHKVILNKISKDEAKHAGLLQSLCQKRGLSIAKESTNRYYNTVELKELSQDELYAIGHYAEGMRLSRIRAILNDTEIDSDIRSVFSVILKDEVMHEKAFGKIASKPALVKMRNKHELGVAALGLSI